MELHQITLILFLITAKLNFNSGANNWRCTEDVCNNFFLGNSCPKSSDDCKNSTKGVYITSTTTCSCCDDICITFLKEGANCVVGGPGTAFPNTMCGENLKCDPTTKKCVKLEHPTGYDPDFFPGYECEKDDCHCAVIEGNSVITIFGEFKKTKDTEKEKQCECSITAYKAANLFNKQFPFDDTYMPSARCLPNGQFDPLQCIDNTCRCVNQETGEWDKKIPSVAPIFTIKEGYPECFDSSLHKPGEYFTECEWDRIALNEEKISAQQSGIQLIYSKKINCKPDGTYA